jgi:hypothetical protein
VSIIKSEFFGSIKKFVEKLSIIVSNIYKRISIGFRVYLNKFCQLYKRCAAKWDRTRAC